MIEIGISVTPTSAKSIIPVKLSITPGSMLYLLECSMKKRVISIISFCVT